METHLADWIKGTPTGDEVESILRTCVHCGFCNATCPTYQLLGDELDGPRGRIYQIKQMFEGAAPSAATQLHLDRCLTCMNCETTCPSGVRYGRLVDIGRAEVERRVSRSAAEVVKRAALRSVLTRPWFGAAVRLGRALRPLLPRTLRDKLPRARVAGAEPARVHARKVLLPSACVQSALIPAIDAATMRVLDALGIETLRVADAGCCGALDYHLSAQDAARAKARRNVDAWWPYVETGMEAIVSNASGCGAMLKDYGHLLHDDPLYAERGARIAGMVRDLAELIAPSCATLAALCGELEPTRIAFHPPCTLQHTQKIRGVVEPLLTRLGATLVPVAESHLCCGAAGTYSILQPELSQRLRKRKLDNLRRGEPELILSANIGCLVHLETGTDVPLRHWIEWIDAAIARRPMT